MLAILGIAESPVKVLPLGTAILRNAAMPTVSPATAASLELAAKLRYQMDIHGVEPPELAALCNVRVPSVYDWMKYGRVAKPHLPKLAARFKTTLGYWLGEEAEEDLDPLERQLLDLYRALPPEKRDELLGRANDMRNEARGNKKDIGNPFGKPAPVVLPRIPLKKRRKS